MLQDYILWIPNLTFISYLSDISPHEHLYLSYTLLVFLCLQTFFKGYIFRFVVLLWILLSIPTVVVTISILVRPLPSREEQALVERSVWSLPDVLEESEEERPQTRIKKKIDIVIGVIVDYEHLISISCIVIWPKSLRDEYKFSKLISSSLFLQVWRESVIQSNRMSVSLCVCIIVP